MPEFFVDELKGKIVEDIVIIPNKKLNINDGMIFIERKPESDMKFNVGDTVKIISESKFNYNGRCIGKTGRLLMFLQNTQIKSMIV